MGSSFSIEFSFRRLGLRRVPFANFRKRLQKICKKSVRASRRQQALSGPQLFKSRQPLRLRDIKLTWDASDGVAGDQELFVGWNYKCMQTGIIRTDLAF